MSTTTSATPPRSVIEVPVGRMGMWWFLFSEVLVFGGLLVSFFVLRLRFPSWAEQAAHTSFPIGALNTAILLTSSLLMVLAHARAEKGDASGAGRFLLGTMLLGLVFLAFKAVEYTREIQAGYLPSESTFWSFYYLMTGLHALHVLGGLVAMATIWWGLRRGFRLDRVEYVGMYWHFVDVVWIFLFPTLYLVG